LAGRTTWIARNHQLIPAAQAQAALIANRIATNRAARWVDQVHQGRKCLFEQHDAMLTSLQPVGKGYGSATAFHLFPKAQDCSQDAGFASV
jgi:hypothetical protein